MWLQHRAIKVAILKQARSLPSVGSMVQQSGYCVRHTLWSVVRRVNVVP